MKKFLIKDKTIYENCTGCSLCVNVCANNAISMKFNDEGFLYPVIDKTKCTKCNCCKKICPMLNKASEKQTNEMQAFAYYIKEDKIRKASSSGGIFYTIANYIISEKKGYVCGAAIDENHHCKHIIVDNVNNLHKIMGSKYVQSDMNTVIKDALALLKQDKIVLFSGTPCQVAAMKVIAANYKNLYTIDLFCHGVPSPKVFEKYIQENKISKDSQIKFRDKRYSWNNYCFTFTTEDGEHIENQETCLYLKGFIENLFLRPSCHNCKLNLLTSRPGDISIGDFWECEKYFPELSDDKGTSAILINSKHGECLFNEVKGQNSYCKEIDYKYIQMGNTILSRSSIAHKNRKHFFEKFSKTENLSNLIKECLGIGNRIGILNHSFSNDNYGAVMVAYSMEQTLKKIGFNPTTILKGHSLGTTIDNFKANFLNVSPNNYKLPDKKLLKANKEFDTIIVGSDQVWRNWGWSEKVLYNWFLNFADYSKNLIAYAASFGIEKFEPNGASIEKISNLLKCYSAISVREQSGVSICKNQFNANAKLVIDPSQLLEAKDYDEIIEKENITNNEEAPYLAYMIFPDEDLNNPQTYEFIEKLAKQMNLKTKSVFVDKNGNPATVGNWLNSFKNASFVITESFHGVMFSIIYKKPFIALAYEESKMNRLYSFFNKLGVLQDRIIQELDYEKALEICKKNIDWDLVYEKRKNFQIESLLFLKSALLKNIKNNGKTLEMEHKNYKITKSYSKINIYLFNMRIIKIKIKHIKAYNLYLLYGLIPIFIKHQK